MDRKKNFERSKKLIKFALENALSDKDSVSVDLDYDVNSSGFIDNIMIFILISLDGDGGYELEDIVFELNRQKNIINNVLSHPKLQFQHDGSLGTNPGKLNDMSDIGILGVEIDPEDFKVSWHAMIQPE